jgi:putative tryptophan/tyrosine transport system substrate-binding protein
MGAGMQRRVFIGLVGGAVVWPLTARAQQPALPVVGFLNGASHEAYAPYVAAFRDGLKETGYIEGQNVVIEYRWAESRYDRLPELAAELVHHQVAVIAATDTPAAVVARAATKTIPVVFTTSGNPVDLGLVTSLNRPGGNATGATQLSVEVAPKRLELLHEMFPKATIMALLINPTGPNAAAVSSETMVAANSLGLELHVLNASTERDIDEAFAKVVQLRASGLLIGTDPFFNGRTKQLVALMLRHAMPTIYQYSEFTAEGGLASYGGSIKGSYRTAGIFTGRILKGEKPADLPVQQTTKIELIINLKAAKALGLTVPLSLLGRADEVIE